MAEPEDDFIARWSRRKREAREEPVARPRAPEPRPHLAGQPASPALADRDSDSGTAPAQGEDLPDPDTLTEESDFTVFMKEGVPDVLRRRALRRLWRLNPLFANLDGLNDYDQDYTDAATVVAGLKTLYKVGRGFADLDEDEPAAVQVEAVPDDATPPTDAPEAADHGADGAVADPNEGGGASDPAESIGSGPLPVGEARPSESDPPTKTTRAGGVRGARARRWGDT